MSCDLSYAKIQHHMTLALSDFRKKLTEQLNINLNPEATIEFMWNFKLQIKAETVWIYLSDTSRFNREMGLAPREQFEKDGKQFVRTKMLGLTQEWIEDPWTWVEGKTISIERKYITGLAKYMQAIFHIVPEVRDQSTEVYIYFSWASKNKFWGWFLKATENILKEKFKLAFEKIKNHSEETEAFKKLNTVFSDAKKNRLMDLVQILESKELNKELILKLQAHILTGDDLELDAIRVMRLAHDWGASYKELLKICLSGARIGLLNLTWSVICPHCRGSRFSTSFLQEIPAASSCTVCDVDFATDVKDALEIVFKIHNSIREIPEVSYCAAEPAKKTHIKIQQKVNPQQELKLSLPVLPGLYRIRINELKSEMTIKVVSGFADKEMELAAEYSNDAVVELGTNSSVKVRNTSDRRLFLVVEDLKRSDLALKPQHLMLFPEFKDLFAAEHLDSNVKIHLGEQALLFTDIVGSTTFYDRVGDAKAFQHVRKHFIEVFSVIKNQEGYIIKTIGDAVMASFPTIDDAFEAAVKIQEKFPQAVDTFSIRLRISIHSGVVIGVHLDSGLDYFGSTINKCAKIQSLAGAGEIVMTEDAFVNLGIERLNLKTKNAVYGSDSSSPLKVKILQIN